MQSTLAIIFGLVLSCSASKIKRDAVIAPAYYTAASPTVYSSPYVSSAPLVSSQYVASAPLVSSPYVASAPLVSSQYLSSAPLVASPYVAPAPLVASQYAASAQYVAPIIPTQYVAQNPVLARASRVLGEPGFVSRYVASPVVTSPLTARYAASAVPVPAVQTVAASAKILTTAGAVESVATPVVVSGTPAKYTVVA